ncbi:MAG: hypothetical protein U0414_12590 [Polyangiaceae bacterium]
MVLSSKDLEKAAHVRAGIDLGGVLESVLEAVGLTPDAWSQLESETIALLTDELDRGATMNLDRFRAAYDATRGEDPAALVGTIARVGPPPLGAPPKETAVVWADVDQTDMVDGRAIREQLERGAMPFDPQAAPALPFPAASSRTDPSGETLMVDGEAIREALQRGAVPFGAGAPPVLELHTADPTNETLMTDGEAIRAALLNGPLPFTHQAAKTGPASASDPTVALQRPDLSTLLGRKGGTDDGKR